MNTGAIRLHKKLLQKGFHPTHLCEVGVFTPEESNLLQFIREGIPTTLVEADPEYAQHCRNFFADQPAVTVVEAAVYDTHGKIELCKRASSTFIRALDDSPALTNDRVVKENTDTFIADSILFSEVDPGTFDLLSVDIEGAEWYVLKHMVSRPAVCSIETHGKYYTNPKLPEISGWMALNGYELWYKDASDSVYVKKGVFPITGAEKFWVLLRDLKIALVKLKRPIKKLFGK